MGMIKDLKMKWKALTPVDKVKLGIDVACGIGSGLLTDQCYNRYVPKTGSRALNALTRFTVDGAGMYVGTKASESWGEVVDGVYMIHQNRKAKKALKAQNKEAKLNG